MRQRLVKDHLVDDHVGFGQPRLDVTDRPFRRILALLRFGVPQPNLVDRQTALLQLGESRAGPFDRRGDGDGKFLPGSP